MLLVASWACQAWFVSIQLLITSLTDVLAYNRQVELEDLTQPPPHMKADAVAKAVSESIAARAPEKGLFGVFAKNIKGAIILSIILGLIQTALTFASPLLLRAVLEFLGDLSTPERQVRRAGCTVLHHGNSMDHSQGYYYVAGFFASASLLGLAKIHSINLLFRAGLVTRAASSGLVSCPPYSSPY